MQEQYTIAKCKSPLPFGMMRKLGIPLPADRLEVLHTDLDWEELKVGAPQKGVTVTPIQGPGCMVTDDATCDTCSGA